jgi:uncharacterized protein YaaW (UPF0174 family)
MCTVEIEVVVHSLMTSGLCQLNVANTEQLIIADTIVATVERKDCSELVTVLLADVFLMDGYAKGINRPAADGRAVRGLAAAIGP